jgi:filamentous hemagglutinin
VRDDANLNGVTLNAEDTLSMYVGGNLDLTSVRDSYSSTSTGTSFGGGLSFSGEGLKGVGTSKDNSRGNYQETQTVLSSITGNNVNIDVGGNTNLKGSLIAAGNLDNNGNFVDNGQLYLSTKTLTYASLSNTMYSESKAIHSDAQYVFSNGLGLSEIGELAGGVANTVGSVGNVMDDGIIAGVTTVWKNGENTYDTFKEGAGFSSSSSWGYSTENGYSSTKVLSTIGQGTLLIKDSASSDDISRLNRDVNNINKYLYSGGTQVTIPTFDYGTITSGIASEIASDVKQLFFYDSFDEGAPFEEILYKSIPFQEILYPRDVDIEAYRLKKEIKDGI